MMPGPCRKYSDAEMREMGQKKPAAQSQIETLADELEMMLPKDPRDSANVFLACGYRR